MGFGVLTFECCGTLGGMASDRDHVINELDLEIARLQGQLRKVQAEIEQAEAFRAWWLQRHPPAGSVPRVTVVEARDQLDRIIEATSATTPEAPIKDLTLKDAIALVTLKDGPLAPVQIANRLKGLGWESQSPNFVTVVRNTLYRLVEEGVLAKQGARYVDAKARVRGSGFDPEPLTSLFPERKELADAAPS